MPNLLNIIHPYTYKLREGLFVLGSIDEYKERDEKLSAFVTRALKSRARVLHHRRTSPGSMEAGVEDVAFEVDPLFRFFRDGEIDSFATTLYGVPIADERPLSSKITSREWDQLKSLFISYSKLREKIGNPDNVFFIGGVFECCLANAATYFRRQYFPDTIMYYIPELCVSLNEDLFRETEERLEREKISPLSYNDALAAVGG